MADTDVTPGHDDLPGVRGEPEPDWVEGIRRGRAERARRLKALLGPPSQAEVPGPDADPVQDAPLAGSPEPPSLAPEPRA